MLNDFFKDPKLGLPATFKFSSSSKIGDILTGLFEIVVLLAAFLAFIWFVWGAFQYIFAGGNKESLAKARARITWAIVGLIITLLAFLVAQFAQQILLPGKTGVTPIL